MNCKKCGKEFTNNFDLGSHERDCKGFSLSLEAIQTIAEAGIDGLIKKKYGFTCGICDKEQELETINDYKYRPIQGICDDCITRLKTVILSKKLDK